MPGIVTFRARDESDGTTDAGPVTKAYEKLALKNQDGKYINENGEFLEDGTLVVPKERLGDLEKEITKLNEIENDIPRNPIETLRFTKDEREALKKLKPKNLLIFPEFIKRN